MKVRKSILWLIAISTLVFLTGYFAFPTLSAVTSSGGTFTVLNDIAYLNWTNGYVFGIIINSTIDNNVIRISNDTSYLTANFSQSNTIVSCIAGHYLLLVTNATTGTYTSNTGILNTADNATMNLIDLNAFNASGLSQSCAPGRYSNYAFTIVNYTNSSENANVSVIVNIPISTNNTLSASSHIGSFSGILPANASYYHSYFFNTSAIPNATAITLNASSSGTNVDMWLLNSGSVVAKSINQNLTEYLSYNFVPAAQMWEARIYGFSNSSTIPYTGYITYSTLNVTDSTDPTMQVSSIDFGTLNVSDKDSVNLNLRNEGNVSLSNITLTSNTYRAVRFGGNGTRSFTFFVGDSSVDSQIYVSLNWTGNSNYTLNLYNPSGSLATTSSNYYLNAMNASVNPELFNTTSIAQGLWNASVVSNSGTDPYNVTVFIYQPSSWITPNVSSISSIAPFVSNATQLNITVPNATIDGTYEGQIFFTDANYARVIIPYVVNVTVPTLIVQNATMSPTLLNVFNSDIYTIAENVNSSLTRSFNLNLTNLGSYDLTVAITNSSGVLTCISCSSTATLALNSTSYIPAHSSKIINFNVSFTNINPQGTYDGWIYINATNSTSSLSSHPYSYYNLTVRLNLDNSLYVQIQNLLSNGGDNVVRNNSAGENVTAWVKVSYINATLPGFGTSITALLSNNFTTVWLQEKNVTSILGRIPQSGNLSFMNGFGIPFFVDPYYYLNFTVPANQPGGQYAVHTIANYIRTDNVAFTGEGINSSTLYINNTGLFMSTNADSCSYDYTCSGSTSTNIGGALTVTAKVANYGSLEASAATINLTTSCTAYTIATGTSSGCKSAAASGTGTGAKWTVDVPAYNTSCYVSWTLTGATAASSCAVAYLMGGGGAWFDPSGVNLTITVINVSTTSTSTSSSTGGASGSQNATAAKYLSITTYPTIMYAVQGTTNSTIIAVKNVNDTRAQNITLAITTLNTSWYSISPANTTGIVPAATTSFSITFTIPNDTAIADYTGNLVASSSYGSTSQSFVVRVLPSNNTKILINDTYQLYKLNYTHLYEEVNRSKAAGMNTSLLETDLVSIKTKLDEVQSFINAGDYFSAAQILNDVKTLLTQAQNDLKNITGNNPLSTFFNLFKSGTLIYILLGSGAVVIVIIAYLFWPAKEVAKSVLFKPKIEAKTESGAQQKLKDKWKEISKNILPKPKEQMERHIEVKTEGGAQQKLKSKLKEISQNVPFKQKIEAKTDESSWQKLKNKWGWQRLKRKWNAST